MSEFTTDIKIDAIAAVKQPFSLNSGTILDTIISIKPFMKTKNIPNVSIVMGNVRNNIIGLIIIFTKASIKAATKAEEKSFTLKMPVNLPTRNIDTAEIKILIIKFIISSSTLNFLYCKIRFGEYGTV